MYSVIDIETTGLDRLTEKINFIGVALMNSLDDVEPVETYIFSEATFGQFRHYYKRAREEKHIMIYQNGKFDTLFIEHHLHLNLPIHHDVMLMGTSYDLVAEHGLKSMAQQYLKVKDWDVSNKDKTSADIKLVGPYLKLDLLYTWQLFRFFWFKIREDKIKWRIYGQLLKPAYKMYRKCERNGIYLDQKALALVKVKYKQLEVEKLAALNTIHKINWNSPKQVSDVLYNVEKLPTYKLSEKTGEPSADAKTLKRLALKGYEIAQMLLDYKFYYGANTKFLNQWGKYAAFDGRIHPSFNVTNVVTGRTSCSNPNLQQVPRNPELRALFTAPEGKILLEADYSQIELRIAAVYANEPTMLHIYETGGDIHTTTAQSLTGSKEKPTKDERGKAKAVNFGFLYGMSSRGFLEYAFDSYNQIFTKAQAEDYRQKFFMKYSALLDWHKEMGRTCEILGGVENMFGRFRALPDIYSQDSFLHGNAYRRAINTPVQSTASDLLLSAAIQIDEELGEKYNVMIVGTVHDSILMEVPVVYKDVVAAEVKRIMAHPKLLDVFGIKLNVPIEADIGFGAWGSK